MRFLIVVLLVLPALLMSLLPSSNPAPEQSAGAVLNSVYPTAAEQPSTTDNLVVLELFTSQGCSSCPYADALLQELDANKENIIALSFHVDYWNYLGWTDPFSSPYYSARQTDYTDALRERTYTPQLIVNGQQAMVGSRKAEVQAAVQKAAGQALSVQPALTVSRSEQSVTVEYALPAAGQWQRVSALLVQPEATSSINRGENRGRELHHVNVVRALEHQPAASSGTLTLPVPNDLAVEQAEVVFLVQDTRTQAIIGAARVD